MWQFDSLDQEGIDLPLRDATRREQAVHGIEVGMLGDGVDVAERGSMGYSMLIIDQPNVYFLLGELSFGYMATDGGKPVYLSTEGVVRVQDTISTRGHAVMLLLLAAVNRTPSCVNDISA